MFSLHLRTLIRAANRGGRPPQRRSFRPTLEALEHRTMLTVDTWTGLSASQGGSPNWSNPGNWSLNAPPGSADMALFTSGSTVKTKTATVDTAFTISGLTADTTWAGTISVQNTLNVTGNFKLQSGFFSGAGPVTIGGTDSRLENTDLRLGSFVNNGSLAIKAVTRSVFFNGPGTYTNNGTINLSGANQFELGTNNPVLNNAGTFNITSDNFIFILSGSLNNTGKVKKTTTSGTATIDGPFNNQGGTINAQTGQLNLSSGGLFNGGVFMASLGATLDLVAANKFTRYAGTFTGSGSGTVALSHGTISVQPDGVTFNLPGNLFHWSSGTIEATSGGAFTNAATGTINLDSSVSPDPIFQGPGDLINLGKFNHIGSSNLELRSAVLHNAAGATYNLDNGEISGSGTIVNAGLFTKGVAGSSISFISPGLSNTGRVEVHNGILDFDGPISQVFGNELAGGTWSVFGSATVHASLTFLSVGDLTALGPGTSVTLNGPNSDFFNLHKLSAILAGASFSLLAGQSLTLPGRLINSGTLTLSPGSLLTVQTSFTQNSTATLVIQIGGTSAAPLVGSLRSNAGGVTLAGKLTVSSTIQPAINTAFTILDNEAATAITGIFGGLAEGATFTVKAGGVTMTFKISYVGGNGHSVTIKRTA
jgi:fibronectin-binding autotransporter adhesin